MADATPTPGGRWVSSDEHRLELERGSGVSADVALAAGLWSEADPGELSRMTGISRRAWTPEHLPALVFPYQAPDEDEPSLYRVKPMRPLAFERGDGATDLRKYVQPKGSLIRLYFPPSLRTSERRRRDVSLSLLVTEGEKKTLAAESAGLLCIGLCGVSCWSRKDGRKRQLHDDWRHIELRERRVFVVFDSDGATNILGVRREEQAFGKALRAAGAVPHVVRLPSGPGGAKQGLDDYLVAHGANALRELCRLAKPVAANADAPASAPEPGTALTDLGNAERLVRRFGGELRYVPAWRVWLRWDDRRWARVTDEAMNGVAIATARGIYDEVHEAGKRGDRDLANDLLKHAQRSESAANLANMVRVARALPGVSIGVDALDADPWLLCCPNGTVDLRTGELREHRRGDLITRLAGATFDPTARSDAWERFLATATRVAPKCDTSNGEPCRDCEGCIAAERASRDLADFVQVSAGYALTGDTSEERMWLVQGAAGTGKSTVLEAQRGVLGEYAVTAEFSTFTRRDRDDHGPRPDIARLAGARLVVASEGEDGQRLSEALVKNVTGGERLTARFLYGSDFEFKPQFKLWLATNHEPAVRHDDSGIWRRLLRVPFANKLAEHERDPRLKAEIVDVARSGSAILAWALAGLKMWHAGGLRVPECVRLSTATYRASQDQLADFIEERCALIPSAAVGVKELKIAYKEWRTEVGDRYAPGWQRVTDRLRSEGCEYTVGHYKGRKARVWKGIGLQADGEFADGDGGQADGTLSQFHTSAPGTPPRARAYAEFPDTNCKSVELFRPDDGGRF